MLRVAQEEAKRKLGGEDPRLAAPVRAIRSPGDLGLWRRSETQADFLRFLASIAASVRGTPLSADCHRSGERA